MGYKSMTKPQLVAELEARDNLDTEARVLSDVIAAVSPLIPQPWEQAASSAGAKHRARQRIFDYIQERWS